MHVLRAAGARELFSGKLGVCSGAKVAIDVRMRSLPNPVEVGAVRAQGDRRCAAATDAVTFHR